MSGNFVIIWECYNDLINLFLINLVKMRGLVGVCFLCVIVIVEICVWYER